MKAGSLILLALTIIQSPVYGMCVIGKICDIEMSFPVEKEFRNITLGSTQTLTLGKNVLIEGVDGALGSIVNMGKETHIGSSTTVGNAYAAGVIQLEKRAIVEGKLIADKVKKQADSKIPEDYDFPVKMPVDVSWTTEFIKKNKGHVDLKAKQNQVLEPGQYQSVSISKDSSLTLRTGIYHFDSLKTLAGANIILNNSEGTILLYVRENLQHQGMFKAKGKSSDLLIVYLGESDVELHAAFDASLWAVNANVIFHPLESGEHNGTYYAKSVFVKDDAKISHVNISGKGPAIASIRSAAQKKSEEDELLPGAGNAVADNEDSNGHLFSDTEAGRLLTDYFKNLYAFEEAGKEKLQDALDQLKANAEIVVPELTRLYSDAPENLEAQQLRWSVVDTTV